jgi:cytochrome c peroxidase
LLGRGRPVVTVSGGAFVLRRVYRLLSGITHPPVAGSGPSPPAETNICSVRFKSLGCISCHQGVNVGGNLSERQGIFHPLASPPPEVVRVPSLRNVATTPPYFHDGSAPNLDQAVRRMANAQLDQTLSEQQIKPIVAFLNTLTGTYRGTPVTAASP